MLSMTQTAPLPPGKHKGPNIISVSLQRLQDNLTLTGQWRWVEDDNRPRHMTKPTRLWLRHRVASPGSRPTENLWRELKLQVAAKKPEGLFL